jgi:hypothetical protein
MLSAIAELGVALFTQPFALSLSKGLPTLEQGFDKLSPNGRDN